MAETFVKFSNLDCEVGEVHVELQSATSYELDRQADRVRRVVRVDKDRQPRLQVGRRAPHSERSNRVGVSKLDLSLFDWRAQVSRNRAHDFSKLASAIVGVVDDGYSHSIFSKRPSCRFS